MAIDEATEKRVTEFLTHKDRMAIRDKDGVEIFGDLEDADGCDRLDILFMYVEEAEMERSDAQGDLENLEEALGPFVTQVQSEALEEMRRIFLNVARETMPPSQCPEPRGLDLAGYVRVLNVLVERARQTA